MGFRFLGTPVVAFTNMKIGLVDALGLEPSAGYYTWKDEYSGPYYSSESTNSMLIFFLMGDINAIRAKRSNLVLKLGAAYGSIRSHYSSDGTESTASTPHFAVLGGIGIEHFVNRSFSVYAGALSGHWSSTEKDTDWESKLSLMSLNTQLLDFSLTWYLE